ncbi:MAG TPA: hypothetical protein VFN72_02675 [Solirubrobacterales bacterium]|nr:hypothetical protein [Solirubrobacterales bacterium]
MKTPWRMLRGISSDLERLTLLTEELQTMRESEERLRGEMKEQQQQAEEREAELNKKVKDLTKSRNKARADRDKVSTQLESLQNSQSFKIGHAIVQVARFPMSALRSLRRGARRLLPSGRQAPQLESAEAKARKKTAESKPKQLPKPKPKKETGPKLTIPAETPFMGPLNEGYSTTMFLVWGFTGEDLANLISDVARLQMMKRDFNPLFVTDADTWAPFQEHGYWFEYIPPAEEWMEHNPDTGWSEFVAERIDSIVATYAPDRIVVYEDTNKREALRRGVLNGVVATPIPVDDSTKAVLPPVASTAKPVIGNGDKTSAVAKKSPPA